MWVEGLGFRVRALVSLSLRLKDLLGPVTRVKKKVRVSQKRRPSRRAAPPSSRFARTASPVLRGSGFGLQGFGLRVQP